MLMEPVKTIVLGISGGIAAYKMANFAHLLSKQGYEVHVVMTENATKFITPLTMETLTGQPCVTDTFRHNSTAFEVEHVALAKKADLMLIAPATANVMAKLACGLADDALTTQVLACTCPKLIAPAMNTAMWNNVATQRNVQTLREDGFQIIEPDAGLLACGDVGAGKLPTDEVLYTYVEKALHTKKDLKGVRVLVTAGGTQESLDPVRYLTNHSTGKMGYAIARECMLRGAEVTLVSAPTCLDPVPSTQMVPVRSAEEMFEEVRARLESHDIFIKAAAVADYRPAKVAENKIKKASGMTALELECTQDILSYLGAHRREGQFICGFSMETTDLIQNSRKKLEKKCVDMIVANNLKEAGAGFGTDTNIVTLITKEETKRLPCLSKAAVATALMDEIVKRRA